MELKKISLEPLKKALASLKKAAAQPVNEFNRDSVIQRFEYTFELCWKSLQKILESDRPLEDPSIKGILRSAASMGYLSNLALWFKFHESRNLTVHTYNEDTAQEVYEVACQLPKEAEMLILTMEKKIKSPPK